VFLGAKSEGVDVDTGIGGTGMVLVRLDNIEVRALALRETVLAVKLKLGSDHRVLTPAMHIKSSLGKNESSGIRHGRTGGITGGIADLEDTITGDEGGSARGSSIITESMDGIRKSINSIGIIERLGTKSLEKSLTALKGSTVINVSIGLHNPDKLLTGVVEVKLDLVGGRTHRFITSELHLFDEVLVGILGHLAALVGIKEDIVNVQRSSNKRLLVCGADRLGTRGTSKVLDGPEALANGAEINVNLDLVVLEGNKGKSKSGIAAKPELKRHVKGSLRKSITGSAHLGRSTGSSTRARHVGKPRISNIGKLGSVSDHLVVASLLLLREGKLIPDMHPITVLTVNALTTNLNLNLGNELLTDEVQPTGIDGTRSIHILINLRNSYLKVSAVGKITVSADCAGNTTAKIGLSREGLLDGLHCEVSVASVRHLPKGNFRGSSKEHVLGAISDKLHKSSSHFTVVIL
jgi:hypothetical protein